MAQTIIMADIIDSHTYDQKQLMDYFKAEVTMTNQHFVNDINSPLTITLGDEFQGIVKNLETAVDVILHLEESFVKSKVPYKLRYIIHHGKIETEINPNIAHAMLGPGLTKAREMLENLKSKQHRIEVDAQNQKINELLNSAFFVMTDIIDKWNHNKDFELASMFISNGDYKIVAEITGKSRSQLWKRQKNLNVDAYNAIKNVITLAAKFKVCHS